MNEKEKMLAGELYRADDPQLSAERRRAKLLCYRFNQSVAEIDTATLKELLGRDTDAWLEPPFYCDYGYNLTLGERVYANHNLVVLDCATVTIGDDVMIGPNVTFATASHPLDPVERASGVEYALPIAIGSRVWIGAGVTVLAGVTIGDNTIIGAGSVVNKSILANCVAVGNPCRVIRDGPGVTPL